MGGRCALRLKARRRRVEGCAIVTTATSSNEPVFRGEWLEAGTHVNTMIGSDHFYRCDRTERGDTCLLATWMAEGFQYCRIDASWQLQRIPE